MVAAWTRSRLPPASLPSQPRHSPTAPHSFKVRATDNEGVEHPPARCDFTVDTAPPDTTVTGPASAKKTQKQKGKKAYKLRPKIRQVAAGKKKALALAPQRPADAKKIAKALKQGTKAKTKLTDELGNKKTEKVSVKLTR